MSQVFLAAEDLGPDTPPDLRPRIFYGVFAQVEEALLDGQILEQYPDTGRGESCLVVGFAGDIPIHAIGGWRGERVVLITVYIPRPPKFIDPWTRGGKDNEKGAV